jgi:hypothetical protein
MCFTAYLAMEIVKFSERGAFGARRPPAAPAAGQVSLALPPVRTRELTLSLAAHQVQASHATHSIALNITEHEWPSYGT